MANDILLNDCCGPASTEPYNPKSQTARRSRDYWFAEPPSPIPAQVEDAGEIREFFAGYNGVVVPYAGTEAYSSHALQAFLISLGDLSPTKAAVINSQKMHAFGGPLEITRTRDPYFELDEEEDVGQAEKRRFYDFVQQVQLFGVDEKKTNFWHLAQMQFADWKKSGDYYFEMVRSRTMGRNYFRVHVHRPTHCLYMATKAGEQRWVLISPIWRADYIARNKPRMLPVYPTWVDEGDGVQRTLVHVKAGDGVWYGRPEDLASMLDQFLEFQNSDYKNKQTASAFIGQAFIEVEDTNPEYGISDAGAGQDGFDALSDQFERNYTNRSKRPQRVILSSRPYGSSPAYVFQFSPNTDTNWFQTTEEIAERNIIKANGWSKRLMDIDAANGFSTNIYLDVLEIHSATTIPHYQRVIEGPVNNIILKEAAEWLGMPDLTQYSLEFNSPFHRMLKERKDGHADGQDQGVNPMDVMRAKMEVYGAGVRAGAITPQAEEVGLPPIGPDIQRAWEEDEGFRRPVTLKLKQEVQKIEQQLDNPTTPSE